MSLNDFNKLSENFEKDNSKEKKDKIVGDIEFDNFEYYVDHIDELIDLVKDSYNNYINSKLKYEFKKSYYQTTINWTDENNLRIANGFPKLTNQEQKNAAIDIKLKHLKNKMIDYEMKYKFFNKILTFIANNFELLYKLNQPLEKIEK